MDFIRFLHAPLLSAIGGLILLFVITYFILKYVDEEFKPKIRFVRDWLALGLIAMFVWFAISAASVNEVPRKVIDRSVVNDRADTVLQQGKEAKEESQETQEVKKIPIEQQPKGDLK